MRMVIVPLVLLATLFLLPQPSNATAFIPGSAVAVTSTTLLLAGGGGRKSTGKKKGNRKKGDGNKSAQKPSSSGVKKLPNSGAPSNAKRSGETQKRSALQTAKKQASGDQKNRTRKKRDARQLEPRYQNIATPRGATSIAKTTRDIGVQTERSQLTKSRSKKPHRNRTRKTQGRSKAVAGTSGQTSKSTTTGHRPSRVKSSASGIKKTQRKRTGKNTPTPKNENLNAASTSAAAPGPSKRRRDKGKQAVSGDAKRVSAQSAGTASTFLSRAPNDSSSI